VNKNKENISNWHWYKVYKNWVLPNFLYIKYSSWKCNAHLSSNASSNAVTSPVFCSFCFKEWNVTETRTHSTVSEVLLCILYTMLYNIIIIVDILCCTVCLDEKVLVHTHKYLVGKNLNSLVGYNHRHNLGGGGGDVLPIFFLPKNSFSFWLLSWRWWGGMGQSGKGCMYIKNRIKPIFLLF